MVERARHWPNGRAGLSGALTAAVLATVGFSSGAQAEDWQQRLSALEQGTAIDRPLWESVGVQLAQLPDAAVDFDIAAQPLTSALAEFGQQSGIQVTVDGALARGRAVPSVRGTMRAEDALRRLLAGTGLTYRITGGSTVAITDPNASGGAMRLDPITVQGRGIVLDPGRTEGSGSYAGSQVSVGSKAPASIREIPQSVSVVTRERMDDQNLTTVHDAMKHTTGVTVQRFDSSGYFNTLNARGYEASNILLDGVATTAHGNLASSMDTAIYDRIEVLRGPAGLFQGAGEPGLTVNLARKRPGRELELTGDALGGSWETYRGVVDASVPLVESGKLRSRYVGLYDHRDSYVDLVHTRKALGYGTLEADLTDDTTIAFGVTHQDIDSVLDQGLPAYADGTLADLPRSTFTGADWNDQDMQTTDYFAELQHNFDNGAFVKATARLFDREMEYRGARANGAIDPTTGNFNVQTVRYVLDRNMTTLDAHGNLPFKVAELEQNIVVGADYRVQEDEGYGGFGPNYTSNIFDPIHTFPEPAFPTTFHSASKQEQYGTYGQLRAKPIRWLTGIVGGRLSWVGATNSNRLTDRVTSDYKIDAEVTPYYGLVADLTDQFSVYGSYASIFQPQTQTTVSGEFLPPRTGNQYEVGVKGEFLGGDLISHIAAYRIKDQNRALTDPANPTFSIAAGEVESEGIEAEVTGTPLRGWNVTAGYAYATTEYLTGNTGQAGDAFAPFTPEHSFNVWTKYTVPDGTYAGLSLGGGVKAVTEFYSLSGNNEFKEDGYITFSTQVGYQYNEHVEAAFTVDNLFDEKYYEKVSSASRQNFYGEPRSFMLTVRGKL